MIQMSNEREREYVEKILGKPVDIEEIMVKLDPEELDKILKRADELIAEEQKRRLTSPEEGL